MPEALNKRTTLRTIRICELYLVIEVGGDKPYILFDGMSPPHQLVKNH